MKNEDINRLNELYERFSNDEDYKEYEELSHQAWSENKNACAERSLLGEVNGDRYILLLPYDKLDFVGGEWKYKHYGFDMEIRRSNGSIMVLCQSLCNRDAKYFVDRMLADKEKAEQEKTVDAVNQKLKEAANASGKIWFDGVELEVWEKKDVSGD